jgi:hypothetical protein
MNGLGVLRGLGVTLRHFVETYPVPGRKNACAGGISLYSVPGV